MTDIPDPALAAAPVPPAPPAGAPRKRRTWLIAGAGALALALAGGAVWAGAGTGAGAAIASQVETQHDDDWGSSATLDDLWAQFEEWANGGGGLGSQAPDQGLQDPYQDFQNPLQGQGSSQSDATEANASQSTGVVLIDTELAYNGGKAAGTGMVLTSTGLVLTNNHVIDGATSISVTDPSTDTTYSAKLVGTDETHDVALLQLESASNLATITIDKDSTEAVGDAITAVGNASGGGVLMAAEGTITDLDASVTTSTNAYEQGETLTGTIEIAADVVSGDSGGALLDSDGEVIGMNTAASSGASATVAYAITIEDALAIVDQIRAGDESGTVTIGYPAFLGVGLADDQTGGATLGYVYDGTPAARAGLVAGDTVTAVDGSAVADGAALADVMHAHEPGDTVRITWTDASGDSHSAKVTLMEGPA